MLYVPFFFFLPLPFKKSVHATDSFFSPDVSKDPTKFNILDVLISLLFVTLTLFFFCQHAA